MAISHVKSNTIADFTGTVTVFNSLGATQTANATDLVRPSDWNSVHNQYYTLTGNTNNASTASGTNVVLSGGNGVTLIGSNSVVGISVATNYQSQGAYLTTAMQSNAATISNINLSAGTTSQNLSAIVFSNSNGVSFGLNGSTVTGTVATNYAASDHSHGNPSLALTNLSGTTASNSAGLTLSLSAAAPGAGGGIAAAAGTQTATSGTVVFSNSNGVSFGMSGSTRITASVETSYAASNHSHGNPTLNLTNLSGTTASNSAGLTLSLSAAAPGAVTLTNYATGNTAQSSSGTIAGSSVILRGSGGVSAGISNGSYIVEGPALTSLSATGALSASSNGSTISLGVGTVTVSATSNTVTDVNSSGTVNLNALIFKGVGNASVGISNGSIVFSASGGTGGGGGVGMGVSTMGNTAGTTGTVTTGNVALVGSGVISLSQSSSGSNATISILAPATSSLVAGTNITISTAGSTITIIGASVGAAPITVSAGTASVNAGAFTFADSNGISFGLGTGASSGSITASHNGLTTQSAQAFSADASSTFQTLVFQDSNGVSFSNNAGALRVTHGLQHTSNTSAITSNALHTSATTVFSNSNNVSFGLNGSTITATATFAQSVQTQNRFNLTLSGNSTSGGAGYIQVSSGTLTLAGGNNITLSQDGNAVTISGPNVGGAQTGISGVIVSDTTYTSGSVSFSNANGISFGSSAGQAITASYTRPVVSNAIQPVGSATGSGTNTSRFAADDHVHEGVFSVGVSTGGNTAGDTRVGAGRFVLVGGNNVTLSQGTAAGGLNTITISAGAGGGGAAISAAGASASNGTIVFSNSNNVSFGMNGSTVTATITVPAQTNQTGGIYFTAQSTGQSSSSTYDLRTLSVVGDGIVSAGWSNGTVRISATQSNQAFSADASSTFQTLTFQNSNGVSFSNNAGALRITHALAGTATAITGGASMTVNSGGISFNGTALAGTGTTFAGANQSASITLNTAGLNLSLSGLNQAVSNSAGSFTFQTLNFSNANNVTWGTSAGNIITASVAAPGAAAEQNAINLLGANTSGNTTATGSTIGLSGINMTLSGTNGSVINLSVPATSSLVGASGITISTNGSTISIYPTTIDIFDNFRENGYVTAAGTAIGNSLVSVQPIDVYQPVVFSNMLVPVSFNVGTAANNSSAYIDVSASAVFYTRNASTLSSVTSMGQTLTQTWSSNATGTVTGVLGVTLTGNAYTMTPNRYWVALHLSTNNTATGGANTTALGNTGSVILAQSVGSAANQLKGWGAQTATSVGLLHQGLVSTGATKASIGFSEIVMTGTRAVLAPFAFALRNNTFLV